MQPLTTCGTILNISSFRVWIHFFSISNMQLSIYRERKKRVYLLGWRDTSFTGFDLLERSFKTQRRFQNSKSSIISVTLSAWLGQISLLSTWITNQTQSRAGYLLLCISYLPKLIFKAHLSFPHRRAVSSQSWAFWSILWVLMQLLLASGGEL